MSFVYSRLQIRTLQKVQRRNKRTKFSKVPILKKPEHINGKITHCCKASVGPNHNVRFEQCGKNKLVLKIE